MTDDLVKRLRDFDPHLHEWEVVEEAADRIEALQAERDQAWKMVAEADTRLGQALGDALQDKADNARLREALDCVCGMGFGPCKDPKCKAPILKKKGDQP